MQRLAVIAVCLLFVTACGEKKPPEKNVFDQQKQGIKKAREVEGKLKESKERREGE